MSRSPLRKALVDLEKALRPLEGSYMLIGGLAVVLRGFPRHTDDIDITILGSTSSAGDVHDLLSGGGFEARIENPIAFAEQNQVLLMRHRATSIELDVSLAWLAFESDAVEAADPTEVEGVTLPVARAEDLIIYKAVAWRERDRRDIAELWALHQPAMDRVRILSVVTQFAEAIDEPERLLELENLLKV